MSHDEAIAEVEQEILSVGFAEDFKIFLMREREFERAERERTNEGQEHIVAGFLSALFFGGIFWGVVIWRFFL